MQDVTILGHSLAGVWLQLVLQKIPGSIGRMLFLDAVILLPGESFFNNAVAGVQATDTSIPAQVPASRVPLGPLCMPCCGQGPCSSACMHACMMMRMQHVHAQAFFTILFSYPFFSQQCSLEVWRELLVNTRQGDAAFVQETYSQLVPEPHGPEDQSMATSAFFTLAKPKAFLWGTEDICLGGSPAQWLLFADRLRTANNGQYSSVVYNVTSDHQSMLTNPAGLAGTILQAAAALGG